MLHPNVTRILDPETQRALDQLAAGGAISQEDVKSIGNKTRKLTQRFDNRTSGGATSASVICWHAMSACHRL